MHLLDHNLPWSLRHTRQKENSVTGPVPCLQTWRWNRKGKQKKRKRDAILSDENSQKLPCESPTRIHWRLGSSTETSTKQTGHAYKKKISDRLHPGDTQSCINWQSEILANLVYAKPLCHAISMIDMLAWKSNLSIPSLVVHLANDASGTYKVILGLSEISNEVNGRYFI